MQWKPKRIEPWINLPLGPDDRTFIPDMIVEIRKLPAGVDIADLMPGAPLTGLGWTTVHVNMKAGWEVRWPGYNEIFAVVIMLEKHGIDGEFLSVRPEYVVLDRRYRAIVITPSSVQVVRGSNVQRAFDHLADRIIEIMTPDQIECLYHMCARPPVPRPTSVEVAPPAPPDGGLGLLPAPTAEQVRFVEAVITTFLPRGVPSFASKVLSVLERRHETIAFLEMVDGTRGAIVITGEPSSYICEWDTDCGDPRPFGYDWELASWGRIDALAA